MAGQKHKLINLAPGCQPVTDYRALELQESPKCCTGSQWKNILLSASQTKGGLGELHVVPRNVECIIVADPSFRKKGPKDGFAQCTAALLPQLPLPSETKRRIREEKAGTEMILNDPEES